MMTFLYIWQAVLTLAGLGLAVTLLALARQIGVLHERVAPAGEQTARAGLEVGQGVPRLVMHTLEDKAFVVGERLPGGANLLLLFVAPECPVCKRVIPVVRALAAERGYGLVFVGDGPVPELKAMVAGRPEMQGVPLLTGVELGLVLQINRLPALVLLDDHAVIRVKDIVNTRQQIEALLDSAQKSVPAGGVTDLAEKGVSLHVAL